MSGTWIALRKLRSIQATLASLAVSGTWIALRKLRSIQATLAESTYGIANIH